MSDIAVTVDHVWKKFHRGELHDSLRDFIPAMVKRLLGRGPKRDQLAEGDFWALKDVAFEVKQGEVLGIVGFNGAGKSTLLKVLSRIIRPNRGSIRVNGRLRALIEIAAGFHPDLTGRENIYLNGAILGMSKREIDRKFDQIVDFSGIEAFLDTPVKRYSSGMHARLGFAVAAHLDPEILLVDEVLSVGDFEFQQKCLGRMHEVASQGRTVLFVSHNMAAVQSLCSRVIVLEKGEIRHEGTPAEAISAYFGEGESDIDWEQRAAEGGSKPAWLTGIALRSADGSQRGTVLSGEALDVCLDYEASQSGLRLDFAVGVYDSLGLKLIHCSTKYSGGTFEVSEGPGTMACRFQKLPLPEGRYRINASLWCNGERLQHVSGAAYLTVAPGDFHGTGKTPPSSETRFLIEHSWHTSTPCKQP